MPFLVRSLPGRRGGCSLQKTMHAKGALNALKMALSARKNISQPLIHHSDRGVQYCSWAYVQRLRQANAIISMTESGDPTGAPERRECDG